jgi:zinc transporter 1/2/3
MIALKNKYRCRKKGEISSVTGETVNNGFMLEETGKKIEVVVNFDQTIKNEPTINEDYEHDHAGHNHKHSLQKNVFIVLISLSAHSFFDGLLLGIQETEKEMWSFLFIVALHHSIMSFSVGNILSEKIQILNDIKNSRRVLIKHLFMTLLWSIIIPLGILITIFKAHIDKLVVAVLMNIATGSFMYITFIELLPQSIVNLHLPFKLDIGFIFLGYSIICILEYIGE